VLSTDSTLTAADRVAIARVEPFSGSALLPRFYLLARPNASGHALGGRPVVVLIDARCANACEAVAAALAALPNVTLLGQRTSGGAGITARLTLRHTGLAVDATIGRFLTATALPVDHTGVAPTIEMAGPDSVHAGTPDDRDPVLDHAIDRLKRRP
jgi:C-terminal processing protease CtpA/Prc